MPPAGGQMSRIITLQMCMARKIIEGKYSFEDPLLATGAGVSF